MSCITMSVSTLSARGKVLELVEKSPGISELLMSVSEEIWMMLLNGVDAGELESMERPQGVFELLMSMGEELC